MTQEHVNVSQQLHPLVLQTYSTTLCDTRTCKSISTAASSGTTHLSYYLLLQKNMYVYLNRCTLWYYKLTLLPYVTQEHVRVSKQLHPQALYTISTTFCDKRTCKSISTAACSSTTHFSHYLLWQEHEKVSQQLHALALHTFLTTFFDTRTHKCISTAACSGTTHLSYLLWDKNFPVACPDPSHPGMGHLD